MKSGEKARKEEERRGEGDGGGEPFERQTGQGRRQRQR